MKKSKVFVYGTLLSGFGNNILLSQAEFLHEAETFPEFTMVPLGGFPGVIMGGDTTIKGELYLIDKDCEASLDMLEGVDHDNPYYGLYRKELINLPDGEKDVLIYIFNDEPRNLTIVEHGNWRKFIETERTNHKRYA